VLSDNLSSLRLLGGGRVCSYFLIGFYYEKPAAASAAKEASSSRGSGTSSSSSDLPILHDLRDRRRRAGWAPPGFKFVSGDQPVLGGLVTAPTSTTLTIAGLLMLAGAAGKSAQFPPHVWLPDAMEGPPRSRR